MSETIWKAVLRAAEIQEIEVPTGAELLCVREQFDNVCIWYRCDPSAAMSTRKIAIVGTGHPAPSKEQARYLGTAALRNGRLMFHVFEELKP